MRLIVFLGLTIFSMNCLASSQPKLWWDLNDVSYLFPLPSDVDQTPESLLAPIRSGVKGQLLPISAFAHVPTLRNGYSSNEESYNISLRVISVRIDPCPAPDFCRPEVRLIWQPVERDEDTHQWTTGDAAVHTFYSLTQNEFKALTTDLWNIKAGNLAYGIDTSSRPLGVHPAFLQANNRANFGPRLQETLLKYCGASNLYKVTFMRLLTPASWWRFGELDRSGNDWLNALIPRIDNSFEDIFNTAPESTTMDGPGRNLDAVINILPDSYPDADNLLPLISRSFRTNDDQDFDIFKAKLEAVNRFQNPHLTNSHTLDCASCHVANAAAFYASTRFPVLAGGVPNDRYANPEPNHFNLENHTVTAAATRVMRGFGYFKAQPAALQRAIDESAESAHALNVLMNFIK